MNPACTSCSRPARAGLTRCKVCADGIALWKQVAAGNHRCAHCAEKAQYTRRGLPVCPLHKRLGVSAADRRARYRRKHTALGLCRMCPNPRHPDSLVYCGPHLLQARDQAARSQARQRAKVSRGDVIEILYGGRADERGFFAA